MAAGLSDAEESGEHHAAEHGEHLAHIGAQQVAQELADVVENASSFAHGCDDGAEVVVGENHFRALFGYFSAGNAHGDADIGGFDGRSVVHAVAGHGHDIPLPLQRFDDFQLVFRRDSRIDGHFTGHLVEGRFVGQFVKLTAGHGLATLVDNAQIGGDASCGQRVVAGNHYRTDAGAMRFCHGITHFRTRRIDDADHADPNQIILKHIALFRNIGNMTRGVQHDSWHLCKRSGTERTVGLTQRAVRVGRKLFDSRKNLLTITFRKWTNGTADRNSAAISKKHIGCTLGEDGQAAGIGVVSRHDGHALTFGSEGDFADALIVGILAIRLHFSCCDDE